MPGKRDIAVESTQNHNKDPIEVEAGTTVIEFCNTIYLSISSF